MMKYIKLIFVILKILSSFKTARMFIHDVFIVASNVLGLNFYKQKVHLSLVLSLRFVAIILNFALIYYGMKGFNPTWKAVYVAIDFIQLVAPLLIGEFVTIRAICMHSFDYKFEEFTRKVYDQKQVANNEGKFMAYLITCIFLCLFKLSLGVNFNDHIYNLSQLIPSVISSSSVFFFVFHINCLKDHLTLIRSAKCDLHQEMLKVLKIKRLIFKRYSLSLAVAISVYFLLILVSLYWIFMRILFGYFNDIHGKTQDVFFSIYLKLFSDCATTFYFIQPCFFLLSMFFANKAFEDEVSN